MGLKCIENMSNISARYVDTCLSDYLQDSYSRDGQTLCLSPLGLSLDDAVESLFDSMDCDAGIPEYISDDDIKAALRDALAGVDLRYIVENGDRCDETPEDDRDDIEPYLYVVLEWDPTVVKVRLTGDFEFYANGESVSELRAHLTTTLEVILSDAAGRGEFTADCDAVVKTWGATAEPVD